MCFQADPWRVISARTDGGNRRGAPEGKDARSDQAEYYSRGGGGHDDVRLHSHLVLLIGVRQVVLKKL